MDVKRNENLDELKHKHYYDIADDEPDIRHWNIVDDSAKKIGEVDDILFDKEALRARYLITNFKHGMFEVDHRVLIPVGRAQINREEKRIVLPSVTKAQMLSLPEYKDPEHLTEEDELAIRRAFSKDGKAEVYNRQTFYEHEDFDQQRFHRG